MKNLGKGCRKEDPVGGESNEGRGIGGGIWEYELLAGFCEARRHFFVNGLAWLCFSDLSWV